MSVLDEEDKCISLEGKKIKVEDLIFLIRVYVFKSVELGEEKYYCFSKKVFIFSLGKVCLIISFDNAEL